MYIDVNIKSEFTVPFLGLVLFVVVGIRRQAEQSLCNIALRQTQVIEQSQDPDELQVKYVLIIIHHSCYPINSIL